MSMVVRLLRVKALIKVARAIPFAALGGRIRHLLVRRPWWSFSLLARIALEQSTSAYSIATALPKPFRVNGTTSMRSERRTAHCMRPQA